jgi:hypothetical protein
MHSNERATDHGGDESWFPDELIGPIARDDAIPSSAAIAESEAGSRLHSRCRTGRRAGRAFIIRPSLL